MITKGRRLLYSDVNELMHYNGIFILDWDNGKPKRFDFDEFISMADAMEYSFGGYNCAFYIEDIDENNNYIILSWICV